MDYSKTYVSELILSVQRKSSIWDKTSKEYKKHNNNDWVPVVDELRKSPENQDLTVYDAKYTWHYLLAAYNACLDNGNPLNFEFFDQMSFVGDTAAWYKKQAETYEVSTVPAIIVKAQTVIFYTFAVLFAISSLYQLKKDDLLVPDYFLVKLVAVTMSLLYGQLIIPVALEFNKFFSPKRISLKWLSVAIPAISLNVENVFFSLPSATPARLPTYFVFCQLGMPVLFGNFHDIYGFEKKRPFPPSQRLAFFHFAYVIGWANMLYVINETISANWMFYIFPAFVVLNALMSVFYNYYMWNNLETIFPKFTQVPFEMVVESPHRIRLR